MFMKHRDYIAALRLQIAMVRQALRDAQEMELTDEETDQLLDRLSALLALLHALENDS
ncbi:hypothetical protein SAMN04488090_1101 [Siphonobacter aquaeclarae]|jgi:hypothetical protein|uniref:Uncharacterized protein n=2 Tax=Siphonobacter aquaeclarae TaxID=563176 RepID=A0A1G9KQR7_9BACT|nr:hypothetical protein SAMN04488090_1101 [Siphonobacter aquaeclarae]